MSLTFWHEAWCLETPITVSNFGLGDLLNITLAVARYHQPGSDPSPLGHGDGGISQLQTDGLHLVLDSDS